MVNLVGQQVGSYKIVRLLGEGGFAEVYLGEHIYLKSLAAIKVLSVQFGDSEKGSFLAEARTLVNLKHPHIVQILDFGIEGRTPFLVMEYAPRGTLRQIHPKDTSLPPATIVNYVKQVASALQYAHDQRLIHRDIKPENMLLREDNNILLADFGIALIAQSTYQSHKEVVGTAAYMSPEQIRGKPYLASDQYSLGVVVYEWLSGSKPFQGSFTELCAQHIYAPPPSLREKLPTLSPAIERVVQTALAKEPNQRFGSIQEFANALEQACQVTPLVARVLPTPPIHVQPVTHYTPQNPQYATVQDPQANQEVHFAAPRQRGHTFYAPNMPQTHLSSTPPSGVQPRRYHPGLIILCAALALLLLIGGGGLFYLHAANSNQAPPSKSQPKPTVPVQAQATIPIQPTAQPSPTPQPTTPPTPQELYTMVTSGTPVLDDPLTSPSTNNWDLFAGTSGCTYQDNTYHAKVAQTGSFIRCYAQATQFRNFAFQIDMTTLSGKQQDGGGIIFRATQSENYRLRVGIDGSYDLVNQEHGLLNGSSPAIKTGLNQTNTLTIIAQEQHIYLYINQQFVADVNAGPTISGKIGVMAVGFNKTTEVAFSNAKVWQL